MRTKTRLTKLCRLNVPNMRISTTDVLVMFVLHHDYLDTRNLSAGFFASCVDRALGHDVQCAFVPSSLRVVGVHGLIRR